MPIDKSTQLQLGFSTSHELHDPMAHELSTNPSSGDTSGICHWHCNILVAATVDPCSHVKGKDQFRNFPLIVPASSGLSFSIFHLVNQIMVGSALL